MNHENLAFVVKIVMWSFALAIAIKYLGTLGSIPPAPALALIPVLGVPLGVAVFLAVRSRLS